MGTLIDKLTHLKSVKEAIKTAIINKGINVSDEDTFSSYADKINGIKPIDYAISAIMPNYSYLCEDFIDELGVAQYVKMFIFPELNYDSNYRVRPRLLIHGYNAYSGNNSPASVNYADFSRIKVPNNRYVEFINDTVYGVGLKTLILPDKVYLKSNAFGASRINKFSVIVGTVYDTFERLIFRGNVYSCSSSWLICTDPGRDIKVSIPKDFTGTLYLSKARLTAETLVSMFENLADLTDTGKEYTLNLGTSNLDRLTDEQKQIAYDKGWTLT